MQLGQQVVNNLLGLGGVGSNLPSLIIPEGNSQGYFSIHGANTPTAGRFQQFVKNGVAYQVTAGKTFRSVAVISCVAGAGALFQLASGTAAVGDDAAALTGGVYQMGSSGKYGHHSTTSNVPQIYSYLYDFAAATYPCFQAGSNLAYWVCLIGKEI